MAAAQTGRRVLAAPGLLRRSVGGGRRPVPHLRVAVELTAAAGPEQMVRQVLLGVWPSRSEMKSEGGG